MTKHVRDLIAYRELLWSLTRRQILARYKQTAFGAGWAIIQPLAMVLMFVLVFGRIARIPSEGIPYPLFAYAGLLFWTFFAAAVTTATTSLVANTDLVRKIYFPRELFLISAILAAAFDLLVAATVFVGVMGYYGVVPGAHALLVAPIFAIHLLFLLGVVCWTSAMHVKYRDIGHALPLALQVWMFASPVAYPAALMPAWLRFVNFANPLSPIIEGYRRVLLQHTAPDWGGLAIAAAIALALFAAAYRFFKRSERIFADVI